MSVPHLPGQVIATISSLLPSLLPTEQAVATALLEHSDSIVELSSQQVADLAGASRATVVRTCQSLGYTGYQQLRVLLARDAAHRADTAQAVPTETAPDDSPMAVVGRMFRHVADSITPMLALLDAHAVAAAVDRLATSPRVVVVGNGLSSPLALDAAARFTAFGRPAEAPIDVIHQQITARGLTSDDTLFVVSGSGSNTSTLLAAEAARDAGAVVVAVTAFARSPLSQLADIQLVVTAPDLTFHDEVTVASRVPQAILVEALVAALGARMGARSRDARTQALDVIAKNLSE